MENAGSSGAYISPVPPPPNTSPIPPPARSEFSDTTYAQTESLAGTNLDQPTYRSNNCYVVTRDTRGAIIGEDGNIEVI